MINSALLLHFVMSTEDIHKSGEFHDKQRFVVYYMRNRAEQYIAG